MAWTGYQSPGPFDCAVTTLRRKLKIKLQNRFGGEECTMPGYAAAVYDTIIGAERFEAWDIVQAGLRLVPQVLSKTIYGGP